MDFLFPLDYSTPVFRPPSEAHSLLLQLTLGCSHNRCTFCNMYRSKTYTVRSVESLKGEIDQAAKYYGDTAPLKVFFCDGDALGAPMDTLVPVLEHLNHKLPNLRRVGIYATAPNILEKSVPELILLAKLNLNLAYLGLESGSDQVLKMVVKGNSASDMVEASDKLRSGGWQSSVIAMLGLGGRDFSREHVEKSGETVSQMSPDFFSFLTTIPVPGTPYARQIKQGGLTPLTVRELLSEMHDMLERIDPQHGRVIFRANHVSNQHPLGGVLPEDTPAMLSQIKQWITQSPQGSYPEISPHEL
ncbi:MAG: radical SAM protein [Bdellovibrionales bacterium]|nr:radical SAM protein [Bdellovibrionales bacterium]